MTHAVASLPTLESGDRMGREEFHRRYEQRPDIRRAELVEGVVYVPSPMRYVQHDRPNTLLTFLMGMYAVHHPEVECGSGGSIFISDDTEVQPDAFLFRPASARLRIRPDGYLEGAPELVVEVAASSLSRDLHDKLRVYERHGVLEYIVWRTEDAAIDWFQLREGQYVRREPDEDGVIESEAFPGFRLDIPRLLEGDRAGALAAIR